ncbi:MAG TPA: hypothetical protein VKI43_00845, partial [Vicinamibacterales bacterium]|nr:hypothetical protein [Vicinamibacterales bacterium]
TARKPLASLLVTLNLLAVSLHAVSQLCVLAWRTALAARGARYRFFEDLRCHRNSRSQRPTMRMRPAVCRADFAIDWMHG